MPVGNVGVSGYTRKSATGKIVHVSKYTQKRDLVAEMNQLGRAKVAAPAGQMPGGRAIPLSPGVSREQLKLQKAQLAALRKQVKAMRAANPELAAQVQSTSTQMGKTVSAQIDRDKKKADKQKSLESAKKLQNTRGADPEKLKKATEQLDKAVQSEKNRKAAAETAAKTRAENKAAEEKAAAAEKEKNTPKPLTPEEADAVASYGYAGYRPINGQLRFRGGLEALDDKYAEDRQLRAEILAMDSAIEKSPLQEDKVLYRGIGAKTAQDGGFFDKPLEPGSVLEDLGFLSFTEDQAVSTDFGALTVHLEAPAGTKALDMNGRGIQDTDLQHEKEFILPRGTRLEVVSDTPRAGANPKTDPDARDIVVRIVPAEGEQNGTGQGQGSQEASTPNQEGGNPTSGQEGSASAGQEAQSSGVQGSNDVGAGGPEGNPTGPEVTAEDLNTILGSATTPEHLEAAGKVFNGEFGDLRTEVFQPSTVPGSYLGSVHGRIFSGDAVVGRFQRDFKKAANGDTVVWHSDMKLDPAVQGQGFAHAFNRQAEEAYKAMGVKSINLGTDEVGGYAWARAGYDWNTDNAYVGDMGKTDLHYDITQILDRIQEESDNLLDDGDLSFYDLVQEQLDELRNKVDDYKYGDTTFEQLPTPYDLSQIGYRPGDINWPGKTGMIGTNWGGIKRL